MELYALERLKNTPFTYNWENGVATFSRFLLFGSFSYLQVIMTLHKSLDEFEMRPDLTMDYRVICP